MTKEELDEYCSYKPKIEHKTTQKGKHPLAKKCICVETKEVFDCMQEAIDKYNACCVRECCNGTRKYSGKLSDGTPLKWMFYDDFLKLPIEEQNKILSRNQESSNDGSFIM